MNKSRFILVLVLVSVPLFIPVSIVSAGQEKVAVCHITGTYDFGGGEVPVGIVISIADPAYQHHLDHGDPPVWTVIYLEDGSEVCTAKECSDLEAARQADTLERMIWVSLSAEVYYADEDTYPEAIEVLCDPVYGIYTDEQCEYIKHDSWGNECMWYGDAVHYTITSYGSDGLEGCDPPHAVPWQFGTYSECDIWVDSTMGSYPVAPTEPCP